MIAWKLLLNTIPQSLILKKYEVELRVILDNGSEICLKGCDNEDTLKGVGVEFAVLDEYASMKPNVWYEIIRPMLTDTKGRALFIGTPKGKNSLWELYMKGQRNEDGFKSWQFKTQDNPFIDPLEIEQARKELPGRYFRQEYEASFEDYVGLVWPEFRQSHVIEPTYIPSMFPRIGAIDPAMSGTTGVLKCAIDDEGCLIIYDEYYETNVRVDEVCTAIKEENIRWYIDPSSAEKNIQKEGKLYSLYNEYADNGIRPFPAENDVEAGINRVAEFLKQGRIRIFSSCKNLIAELERYHWAEERETVTGVVKPKPYKKADHLCDCLRYIIMSRVKKADLKRMITPEYDSPIAHVNREREAKGLPPLELDA